MFWLLALLAFVVGTFIGSFLNVVIMRTLIGEQWVKGRSRCDFCKTPLQWYELIPLLSFVVQRGKCRSCQKDIDPLHPFVELVTGSLFAWWVLVGFAFFKLTLQPFTYVQPAFWLLIGILLIVILVSDWRWMIIPDWATVGLIVLIVLYRSALMWAGIDRPVDYGYAMMGATLSLLVFLGLWLVTKGRGMGFGDVKLVFPLALLIGWPETLVFWLVSFWLGALVGVGMLSTKKWRIGKPIPFGPFLVAGAVITMIWGSDLLNWYSRWL